MTSQQGRVPAREKDYYFEPTGAEPFAIGEKGYVAKGSFDSVDGGWIQGEIDAEMSYSTVGTAPEASLAKAPFEHPWCGPRGYRGRSHSGRANRAG